MTAGDAGASPAKANKARWRAFVAAIVSAIHVPLSEIARLTDRQLVEIYAHERDEHGAIKVPEEKAEKQATASSSPPSLERDLRDLTVLAGMLRLPQAKFAELADKIRAKWASKEQENTDGRASSAV